MINSLKDLFTNKTVALVGSAPSLKEYGELIDSFDIVVRFNLGYPTIPEKLGTKTDVLCSNCHVAPAVLKHSFGNYIRKGTITREYAENYSKYMKSEKPFMVCRNNSIRNNPQKKIFHLTHSGSITFCDNFLKKMKIPCRSVKWPRMGYHLVCYLVNLGIKPTLFYFDITNPSGKKYYNPKPTKMVCHDAKVETKVLNILSDKGLISTEYL